MARIFNSREEREHVQQSMFFILSYSTFIATLLTLAPKNLMIPFLIFVTFVVIVTCFLVEIDWIGENRGEL